MRNAGMDNPREQVISKLEDLSDEEVVAVLHYIEAMASISLPEDYNEVRDPAIGFFSAEPDFASRTEEILQEGFGQPKS